MNESWNFQNLALALDLERVIVIVSGGTASASETVINSLTPFIDVVLVGERTYGKPVAMIVQDFCDMVIGPIVAKTTNANNVGDYYDGFAPDCAARDEVAYSIGDPAEDDLKQALYYQLHGACEEGRTVQVKTLNDTGMRRHFELHGFKREIGAL